MFSHTKRIISILLILSMIFTSGGINTFAVSISHYVDKVIENTQNNEVIGLDKSSVNGEEIIGISKTNGSNFNVEDSGNKTSRKVVAGDFILSYWVFDSELNRYVVTDVNHALLSGWKYTNGANV